MTISPLIRQSCMELHRRILASRWTWITRPAIHLLATINTWPFRHQLRQQAMAMTAPMWILFKWSKYHRNSDLQAKNPALCGIFYFLFPLDPHLLSFYNSAARPIRQLLHGEDNARLFISRGPRQARPGRLRINPA